MSSERKRFFVLDLVRGLAVFLMMLAHSVYFFYSGANLFILSLATLGNTFCFTLFLFISGATLFVAYLGEEFRTASVRKRIFRRLGLMLPTYYLLALIVSFKDISAAGLYEKVRLIVDIVSFRSLPSYTEYIPPFIFFSLFLFLAPRLFVKIGRSLKSVIILGSLFYLAGYFLNLIPVSAFLDPWKAFLVGSDGFFRFPLFQYFPVFLLGLNLGYQLLNREGLKGKIHYLKQALLASGLLFLVISLVYAQVIEGKDFLHRWPPSPSFLLLGIFAVYGLGYVFYQSKQLRYWPLLRNFLLVFGQNAYAIFWIHIAILSFYFAAGGGRFDSIIIYFVLLVCLIILTLALATFLPFNFRFNLTMLHDSHEEQEEFLESQPIVELGEEALEETEKELSAFKRFFFLGKRQSKSRKRLVKKRHIALLILCLGLTTLLLFPTILSEIKSGIITHQKSDWWSDSYSYRQNFSVKNEQNFTSLPKGSEIQITFDHKKLVSEYQADQSGSDLKIVFYNGKKSSDLDYKIVNDWNRNDTSVVFALPQAIASGDSDLRYYLYFGNTLETTTVTEQIEAKTSADYKISYKAIEQYEVLARVNRRWNIADTGQTPAPLLLTATTDLSLATPTATWELLNSGLSGQMTMNEAGIFESQINLKTVIPGKYQVRATIKDGDNIYYSQKCGFIVSRPLYVAWTIDWEGLDTTNASLEALTKITSTYDLPMTHFWNARLYATNTINDDRKSFLTGWLKQRLGLGDGIALHLHMFYDLVSSAGVTPRVEPNWGDGTIGQGYGVPVTAYPSSELTTIIEKSISLFEENGLPRPNIFRAGAWFADESTLNTLSDLGFVADSSGRTQYSFGTNNLKGPWDLESTTQPYRPSKSDQNQPSLGNAMNILEIPDNGADSYWFPDTEMIKRFQDNLGNAVLKDKKAVTFLTHPHWFGSKEQAKINNLFNYVSKYSAEKDSGPVKFVTTNDLAQTWNSQ